MGQSLTAATGALADRVGDTATPQVTRPVVIAIMLGHRVHATEK